MAVAAKAAAAAALLTEDPDTLQSTQYARVLDLISEGEIDGIEGGQRVLFLMEHQFKTPTETTIFKAIHLIHETALKRSHTSQTLSAQSEKAVGVEVLKTTPVTRSITDSDVDRVRVTIQIPQLQNLKTMAM